MQQTGSPVISPFHHHQDTKVTSAQANLTTAQKRGIALPPVISSSIRSPSRTLSMRSLDNDGRSRSSLRLRTRGAAKKGGGVGTETEITLINALGLSPKRGRKRAIPAFGLGTVLGNIKRVGLRAIGGTGKGLGGGIGGRVEGKWGRRNENLNEEDVCMRLVCPGDTLSGNDVGEGLTKTSGAYLTSNFDEDMRRPSTAGSFRTTSTAKDSPLCAQFASYHYQDEEDGESEDDPFRTPLGSATMVVDGSMGSPPLSILTNSPESTWRGYSTGRGGGCLGKAEFSRRKVGKILGDGAGEEYRRLLMLGEVGGRAGMRDIFMSQPLDGVEFGDGL